MGPLRAALWKNGTVTDLNTLVPADTDLYLLVATSMNDSGAIAGFGVSQSTGEFHAFLLVPGRGSATAAAIPAESAAAQEAELSAPTRALSPIHVKLPKNVRRQVRGLNRFGDHTPN